MIYRFSKRLNPQSQAVTYPSPQGASLTAYLRLHEGLGGPGWPAPGPLQLALPLQITVLQLSALLKQADSSKRKLTLTRLASAPVPFTVLSLTGNPCKEDYLAVCGQQVQPVQD